MYKRQEKAVRDRLETLMNIKGSKPVDYFHKRLGKIMWDDVVWRVAQKV